MKQYEELGYKIKNGILCFQKGPFSCWWGGFKNQGKQPQFLEPIIRPSDRVETSILGFIPFNCVEQFFMYTKAMTFYDFHAAMDIIQTSDPKVQQQLGRKVRGYNQELWDCYKETVMFNGNLAKFMENPELKELLKGTGDLILAEASDFDTIWGIGLDASDERAFDQNQWRGQNLLGKCLMKVRENLG